VKVLADSGWQRRVVAVLAAIAALGMPAEAKATAESDAKDLFARGRELRIRNDCGSAVPLFRKAWTIYPAGLGSLRNLAECEELLGNFASARRTWLDLKRSLMTAPSVDPKYEGWDTDAEEAAARLATKVATFVVDVYVQSPEGEFLANDTSGVEIFVNGESVGTALVGTPIERDPGAYRLRAQLADAQTVEQTVTLAAGDHARVTIRLSRMTKTMEESALVVGDHSTRRTLGWVTMGVGAASLIVSGVTFLLRNAAKNDLDSQCASHVNCPSSLQDTVEQGKTLSTLTAVFLAVGVAGAGAGLALVLTGSRPSTRSAKTGAWLRLEPTIGGANVYGRF
jgi:hypothetical protein